MDDTLKRHYVPLKVKKHIQECVSDVTATLNNRGTDKG